MTVIDIAIGADTLSDAFDQFAANWWTPEMYRAIAVFHNAALVARVLPVINKQTQELEPHIEMLNKWS